jgi:kinesin family member 6/9
MVGGTQNYKYRGIVPRAIAHLFRTIHSRPDTAVVARISYLEIYNEQFYDLLVDDKSDGHLVDLAVRDDEDGIVNVKGLSMHAVSTEEEALNLLFRGETNRATSPHQTNRASSRSHCIFTVLLESRSRVESSEKVTISKLNLVDLAGSERIGKTQSTGTTLSEAKCTHCTATHSYTADVTENRR